MRQTVDSDTHQAREETRGEGTVLLGWVFWGIGMKMVLEEVQVEVEVLSVCKNCSTKVQLEKFTNVCLAQNTTNRGSLASTVG